MPECDFFKEVDFGEGPVRVRCTARPGWHSIHSCSIVLGPVVQEEVTDVEHHNVFFDGE